MCSSTGSGVQLVVVEAGRGTLELRGGEVLNGVVVPVCSKSRASIVGLDRVIVPVLPIKSAIVIPPRYRF